MIVTSSVLAQTSGLSEAATMSRPISSTKCTVSPTIDGDITDEAWKQATRAEQFFDLFTNAPVDDSTTAYIMYDDKYIYVAFDCRDPQPDQIVARETVRDSKFRSQGDNNTEDAVSFGIDPYNTKKVNDVSEFSVNAIGTPSAALAGGRGGKLEWKGNWESAAKRTSTGYTVEMRIPWEMLNFPNKGNKTTLGINFWRYHNRTKQLSMWSNVTPSNKWEREGQWLEVTPPHMAYKPQLSVLPYVLPGVSDGKGTFRSGVDARLTLTPELTYVSSLNPDFGTIEGAVESIAYSRKERYVQDRRPFFLEGGDNFAPGTTYNDIGAFFYPNRIDSFDFGNKLYGKLNPKDTIGFMNASTFGRRTDTIFRFKHDLSDTSDVGLYYGSTIGSGLNPNSVMLVDQHARFGDYGIETQFSQTNGPGTDGGAILMSGNYQRGDVVAFAQYHNISQLFDITDGYVPYTGYRGGIGGVFVTHKIEHGPLVRQSMNLMGIVWDHQDGSRYIRQLSGGMSWLTKKDQKISLNHQYSLQDGTIDSITGLTLLNGATNRFRQYGVTAQVGRFGGQKGSYLAPVWSSRINGKFDVGYSGSVLNLGGVSQQHTVTMGYELSPTRSFGGRMVVNGADTNWYLSYRNAGGKGTDFYVILGDPNTSKFQQKLQLKWVLSL